MLPLQRPNAVLPLESGKDRAVMEGRLRVQVELSRPPRRRAVFKLRPIRMKIIATALRTEGREVLNLEVPRLLDSGRKLQRKDSPEH